MLYLKHYPVIYRKFTLTNIKYGDNSFWTWQICTDELLMYCAKATTTTTLGALTCLLHIMIKEFLILPVAESLQGLESRTVEKNFFNKTCQKLSALWQEILAHAVGDIQETRHWLPTNKYHYLWVLMIQENWGIFCRFQRPGTVVIIDILTWEHCKFIFFPLFIALLILVNFSVCGIGCFRR